MESKEEQILKLFFNSPTREWHFEEILKEAKITRSKAVKWLKKFSKEKLIRRVKERGKMPHYISSYELPEYKSKKRVFALDTIYKSGLLSHLYALKKAKAVILFGSFSRSDWYENSDVDIFVYGNAEGINTYEYELKLQRIIQVFVCKDRKELNKLGLGLIKNIIAGNIVKGTLDFLEIRINNRLK